MLWNRKEEHPQEPAPLRRRKLSPELQKIVDNDDQFYDDVYAPYAIDSTETPYRYAAYATRLRTLLLSAHRYVAYTSDIGESFRPVAHPILVRSAYGISWAYLLGDVGHEGYKAYLRNRRVLAPPCEAYKDSNDLTQQQIVLGMATGNIAGSLSGPSESTTETNLKTGAGLSRGPAEWGQAMKEGGGADTLTPWPTTHIPLIEDYRVVMAKRALFQAIASMGLPAFTIHSVVRYSGRALKGAKSTFARTWVPIGLGLSVVPFLPYLFDHPVEEATEWAFRVGLYIYGGEEAVKPLPRHSEVARALRNQGRDGDSTSLDHFHIQNQENSESWNEHKERLQHEKEKRKQERKEKGESTVLAMLGFGSRKGNEKDNKTE
ncbi:mitochondrial 18 KDa protein-domain-containing protein [Aspergillus unguis]